MKKSGESLEMQGRGHPGLGHRERSLRMLSSPLIHYDAAAKSVRCEVTIITMVSQPLVVPGQVEGNALLTDHFLSHTFNVPGAAHKQRVGLAGKSPPRPRPIKILSQHHSLLREN